MPAIAEATTEAQRIAGFLGIGEIARDRIALAGAVAGGLPLRSAEAVRKAVGARTFHHILPEATFRRARAKAVPLSRETSEKLYEFGRVYELALRIYGGDHDRTMRFLERSHSMLDGKAPLELATSSSAGADAVVDLLNQAEAGFAA